MKQIIDEIKRALENNLPIAALTMALTIPDICGRIHYYIPDVGKRYRNWFNKYVYKYYKGNFSFSLNDSSDDIKFRNFDGRLCYKLRCAILHSGNAKIDIIDKFKFYYTPPANNPESDDYTCITFVNDRKNKYEYQLNINQFCTIMCNAAEEFFNEPQNKCKLNKYKLIISDTIPINTPPSLTTHN